MVSVERDVNDVFDSILLTEQSLTEEGFNEGYEKGLAEGNIDGYKLGYAKGFELGEELGNYYGVAIFHMQAKQPPTAANLLVSLKTAIENFPKTNDPKIDILSEINQIRTLFKRIKAILKIKARTPLGTDLSF